MLKITLFLTSKSMKFFFVSLFLFLFSFSIAFAACNPPCRPGYTCNNANKCVQDDADAGKTGGVVTLDNPLTGAPTNVEPQVLIGKVIKAALGVVGSLALVMFIYGGFTWMLAAGNAEKVKKGKDILIWATIGLVVIFSAYALVNFIIMGIAKG